VSSLLPSAAEHHHQRASSVIGRLSHNSSDTDIDYKRLYEREKMENDRLRKRVDEFEVRCRLMEQQQSSSAENLHNGRRYGSSGRTLNGSTSATSSASSVIKANGAGISNSSSSSSLLDEQERRAYERKMADMEEELRTLDQLRSDNQRLKDENGALIRVISKLSK